MRNIRTSAAGARECANLINESFSDIRKRISGGQNPILPHVMEGDRVAGIVRQEEEDFASQWSGVPFYKEVDTVDQAKRDALGIDRVHRNIGFIH